MLITAQRVLRGSIILRNRRWSEALVQRGLWPGDFRVDDQDRLVWPRLGVLLSSDAQDLLGAHDILYRLKEKSGVEFTNDAEGRVLARFGAITVEAEDRNSMGTFEEIVVDSFYGVTLPPECVVWDVGANAGYAALYFAQFDQVKRVYAYEPLRPTLFQLNRNVQLNPALGHKIAARPYGIAGDDGQATIRYLPAKRASASLYWDSIPQSQTGVTVETMEIKAALPVLQEIERENPGLPVVIKLDCEGAEREIVPRLVDANALGNVPVITAESHQRDYMELVRPLEEAGYTVFSMRHQGSILGIIHAVRNAG